MARAAKPANGETKRVILVTSEKGGVGKTLWTSSFLTLAREEGVKVAAFDADGSVGGLARLCAIKDANGDPVEGQDPTEGVAFYEGRKSRKALELLTSAEHGYPLILHDLAGGYLTTMMDMIDAGSGLEGFVENFASFGYRVTFVHMISSDLAATSSVNNYLKFAGATADHVAVVNEHFGEVEEDFPFWNGFTDNKGEFRYGKTKPKLLGLEGGNGVQIKMPSIDKVTAVKLSAVNLTPAKADEDESLHGYEKMRARQFVRKFAASIEPARHLLGLPA
ncbi:hypothetical protein [Aureimonas phyllosphaerae]|uniref:CobQ/CobB/MinD/ParA nucleotide binding domain-containing protein n=1 Tax=Aureimonas phyllosphaerae TaxID=1166078 RepID=A0A7W6BZL4_9HYPH|nr:hypothetical protein [Aureimonas phyllosphaerae]MBB3938113.1 hypothetical protein [Aureimonas phyllosphaerae]MBB3962120.1 hypothetical protein [Aureimonas phyllosphaerae]SFF55855.1 CobQ/CobB/MinD/ParA nucleotide binding domain-containing protein [Aureimonas phyllosphaerae]